VTAPAAVDLWAIPGQQQAAGVLRAAVARGEVGHAWAFVGPAGVGQQQAARALAAALNCPQPPAPGRPCGRCSTCERLARGAHAAYAEFVPSGQFHLVDDVRERWLPAAGRTLLEGRWQVLRVADAERMNDASANAFLKGLEEPPPRTTWVLDVADPDELPETVLSRCRLLRFGAWGQDVLEAQARRLGLDDPAERAVAVRAALGAPGVLERLAGPATPEVRDREGKLKEPRWPSGFEDFRGHREIPRRIRAEGQAFGLIAAHRIAGRRARKDPPSEVERRVATVRAQLEAEREALLERYGDELPRTVKKELDALDRRREREARTQAVTAALDDLLSWLRDCLLVATGGEAAAAIHADDPDGLRADADAIGLDGLMAATERVFATREHLERNVQPLLALEALFMELAALMLRRSST
jgi:DNA polymerase III subunit delta'